MTEIAKPIRCKVVFTSMLRDTEVPGVPSIKQFQDHTGTLIYCTKPTFEGFYHAVMELDEPTETFGDKVRNCWLAKTAEEIEAMSESDTLWCEVYILPEKPELVDRFAEFCEDVGFSRFLPGGAHDYVGWQQVQPMYAAWLER